VCAKIAQMSVSESMMRVPFNEAIYPEIKQWILEHPQDTRLTDAIKQNLLHFGVLTESEKIEPQVGLLAIAELPHVIQQFIPDRLGAAPKEMLFEVKRNLRNESNRINLISTPKRMYALFQPKRLLEKFLQRVAVGKQDKVKTLGNVPNVYLQFSHHQ
jgi:hypothetical protein